MHYHLELDQAGPFAEPAAWARARQILEAHEEGASRHCLRQLPDGWQHHRLNITITWEVK